MRKPMSAEERDKLAQLGAPMLEEATGMARAMLGEQEPGLEENEQAVVLNGVALSIQALLLASPLAERGHMLALGSAAGAILGQCAPAQQQNLYTAFKDQCAATMDQVGDAWRPQGDG